MELRSRIKKAFGLNPVIVPWSPNGDDVYGHIDGLAKAVPSDNRPESLLIAPIYKKDRDKLHNNLDKNFKIFEIEFDIRGKDFEKYAWAYINFLQVGNKILMPSFGLQCEKSVISQIQRLYPDCKIDTIEMREIADQGGALHCIGI